MTCDCEGRGREDHSRCQVCGNGECGYCGEWSCSRSLLWRPGTAHIDGIESPECGRFMRAGEMAATWIELSADKRGTLRWAVCMGCYEHALREGVTESRFIIGVLTGCHPCGYHGATIEVLAFKRAQREVERMR